jgi:hypothetical protein
MRREGFPNSSFLIPHSFFFGVAGGFSCSSARGIAAESPQALHKQSRGLGAESPVPAFGGNAPKKPQFTHHF